MIKEEELKEKNLTVLGIENGKIKTVCNICGKEYCKRYSDYKKWNCKCLKKKNRFIEKAKLIHGDKYDYSLVEYINNNTKVDIKCNKYTNGKIHGIFSQTPKNHLSGKKCFQCGIEERAKNRINHTGAKTLEKLKEKYPNYDFSESVYTKAIELMNFKCNKHGLQYMRPNDMLNNHGCPCCGNEAKNKDRVLTIETIMERSKLNHGDVWEIVDTEVKNQYTPILVKCKTCGKEQLKPPLRIIYGKCKYCKESQGERKIRLFLEEHKINYIKEYFFGDCLYIRDMPFDFYLPDFKTVIEFQGKQHFKFIEFFGEDLEVRQLKDSIKRKYCIDKGIKEIEISSLSEIEEKLFKLI